MKFYAMLPLRILSRFAGKVLNTTIPERYRARVYKSYAKSFNCNLDEMLDEDLTHYRSIAEFFYRKIKPNLRPIDKHVDLVFYIILFYFLSFLLFFFYDFLLR